MAHQKDNTPSPVLSPGTVSADESDAAARKPGFFRLPHSIRGMFFLLPADILPEQTAPKVQSPEAVPG